jgi:hypothetical protein
MVNFIADVNKWKLPEPPEWFLKRLYDFDPMLVLVPSRVKALGESPAYLLCRRRQHSAGLGDVAMLDNKHPDTNMCYGLGVVPIAPLRFKKNVNQFTEAACESLLKELRARDTWAQADAAGGVDALVDRIEAQEDAAKRAQSAAIRDSFYHRARDAYRSLKARTGQRTKRASDFHGAAPKPQPKQRVILTDAS